VRTRSGLALNSDDGLAYQVVADWRKSRDELARLGGPLFA
jgi:hypothetical protein